MGVDVLSIDGFECEFLATDAVVLLSGHPIAYLVDPCSLGAGHPGEEDIGGLVLVSGQDTRLWSVRHPHFVARTCGARAQDPLHRFGRIR